MAVGNPDLSNSTRSQPSEKTVHLYVFGDSLSDSGNVAALVANISTSSVFCNGRYGDGPVWHDYLEHVLNGTHHGHLFTGCEHVVSIGKGKEGENKEACQSGGRDSNLDIKITVSGEYDLLKAERCHAFDCAGGSRSATATQPDGIADCTMCSRASATNNENCASVKHRDTTVTHEYHISSENTSTPPAGGRVSPRPSERTRHAHAAELLTGHTSDTRIDESGVNEVTAFAVHDNVLNRFGNNPGGNNARYEHLSDVEWEHIIEDDIECDAMQYGTEYSTDTITHVSVYDDSLAKPSPRGEMLITTLAINETECAYTVKVHNYAHGGSTTCNDAQQGFATELFIPVPGVCQVISALPTLNPNKGKNSANGSTKANSAKQTAAEHTDMSTGDTRDLDSREVTVASLWVGTNDVYWSLHQNPMEAVDFVAIADRTVRLVEDVLEKGFDTVLVGRIIDPAYMPGFQYFRLSADQFRALEAGYSEYVVQLEAGLERVRKRREQRPQNEVLYWNPQLIMEQHLSRTPADELGPDQHPQEAAEMNTIICTRAECLFVADGFHPKSSTQSLFGRHVSMMLQKHMMSCDKA